MVDEVPISTTLKWGKQRFTTTIQPSSSGHSLKLQVEALTSVPVHRQKLLCKSLWKGTLKDDDTIQPNGKSSLIITLIGNADVLVEKPIKERPLFSEDLTPEELWKATRPQHMDTQEEDIVDIIALQKEVGFERDDGKAGMYQYNRLVTGLPQHQINDMLVCRKKQSENNKTNVVDDTVNNKTDELTGEVAMTMGMELRKGYVNSLAVLPNGTIVSGLDDGHVQLWRRGELVKDLKHPSSRVEHVRVFPSYHNNAPSFVTAGDECICMWSEDGLLTRFGSYPGTSPSSIAIGRISNGQGGYITYLACSSKITRKIDPNQFRLVPQNEAERQRRRAAEAQERMIQDELNSLSKNIRVFFYNEENQSAVRQDVITPDSTEDSAPITNLLDMNGCLVCGDAHGGIRIYEWITESNNNLPARRQIAHMQLRGSSIACLAMIQENHLAVSIQLRGEDTGIQPSATPLQTTRPRGIYILDTKQATVKAILDAHKDKVQCICPLPNGGVISAGGRMDATCRFWNSVDISSAIQATDESNEEEVKVLTDAPIQEPGYVFDLQVLPDSNGSDVYGIAAARYNVIKIVI